MAKVAMLLGQDFQDSEMRIPLDRLQDAGHEVEVVGVKVGEILRGKLGLEQIRSGRAVADATPDEYDALLIPGGGSPAHLRKFAAVKSFVEAFVASEKPVAAICHGPWLLADADAVRGRRVTSWPPVRERLEAAGAHWVDREVVEDGALITSRRPGDAEAFARALLVRLDRARVARSARSMSAR